MNDESTTEYIQNYLEYSEAQADQPSSHESLFEETNWSTWIHILPKSFHCDTSAMHWEEQSYNLISIAE